MTRPILNGLILACLIGALIGLGVNEWLGAVFNLLALAALWTLRRSLIRNNEIVDEILREDENR